MTADRFPGLPGLDVPLADTFAGPAAQPGRQPGRRGRRAAARSWSGRVGLFTTVVVIGFAVVGPFLAPHSPTELLGAPMEGPQPGLPLGTDYLGHDLLSRLMCGGWKLIGVSAACTLLAYVIGTAIGLYAAATNRFTDAIIMRGFDSIIAFPPLLFLLVLSAGMGAGWAPLIIGVVVMNIPSVVRLMRTAAQEVLPRAFIEAAVARGDSTTSVLGRQVLPNVLHVALTDGGPRLTGNIFVIAALNFLGLGVPPGYPDWASMISENRVGLTLAPLTVVTPALCIAVLTIGINLFADSLIDDPGAKE